MKLSELYNNKNMLTKEQIEKIVFDDIVDQGKKCEYAIVFGNPEYQKYRVMEAVKLYKLKRINKLILTGGVGINTKETERNEKEAWQMKKIALKEGVLEDDIIIEDNSTTTIENCINVAKLLKDMNVNLKNVMLISSQYHLKRCLAIAMKYLSSGIEYYFGIAKDGITDRENWDKTEKGIDAVNNEINLLTLHSNQQIIYNLEINLE